MTWRIYWNFTSRLVNSTPTWEREKGRAWERVGLAFLQVQVCDQKRRFYFVFLFVFVRFQEGKSRRREGALSYLMFSFSQLVAVASINKSNVNVNDRKRKKLYEIKKLFNSCNRGRFLLFFCSTLHLFQTLILWSSCISVWGNVGSSRLRSVAFPCTVVCVFKESYIIEVSKLWDRYLEIVRHRRDAIST